MNPRYPRVAERAGHRCEYCHAPEAVFNFPFEVEHVIPVHRGGSDDFANLALACRACNVRKGAHLEHVDPSTLTPSRLFDPRRDDWSEHFLVDARAGAIQGQTPAGRASVDRLGMNDPAQLEARRLWILLGLFP